MLAFIDAVSLDLEAVTVKLPKWSAAVFRRGPSYWEAGIFETKWDGARKGDFKMHTDVLHLSVYPCRVSDKGFKWLRRCRK